MKFNDRVFDDLSRMAAGAASALTGLKEQIDAHRGASVDGVTREEFETVRAMVEKAREVQEELHRRLSALEATQTNGATQAAS